MAGEGWKGVGSRSNQLKAQSVLLNDLISARRLTFKNFKVGRVVMVVCPD